MSELGARFRREMVLRGFSPRTVESYERAMVDLITGCGGRVPDQLTKEDVQRHLQRLIEVRRLEWSTVNVYFSAYRLFYYRVLNRSESQFSIPPRGRSKHLPWVPDRPTVRAILGALENPKHRALLIMAYGSGLRVSEVCRLKPWHIESSPERMLVRVEQGKGRKDRYTLLSQRALDLLREYWRKCQPGREWLFFGRDRTQAISIGTVQAVFYQACRKAGVERQPHVAARRVLRHGQLGSSGLCP